MLNREHYQHIAFALLILTTFLPFLLSWNESQEPLRIIINEPRNPAPDEKPLYLETFLPKHSKTQRVHSSSIAQTKNGSIRAVWYGGTEEGALDVALYTSVYDPSQQAWSESQLLIGRRQTQNDVKRYIKKIGNPFFFTISKIISACFTSPLQSAVGPHAPSISYVPRMGEKPGPQRNGSLRLHSSISVR